jgi:cell division protein FtsN
VSEAAKDGDSSRSGGFNGIVVALLVLVGVAGAGFMIRALYSSPAAPPAPAKVAEAPIEAPPAAATAVPESSLRPGSTRYSLQLSPYSEVATAEDVRAKLDKLGMSSSLRIEAHVQVGPFRSAEEAEAARTKLKELGVYGGQITTLKP